jgi:hypothetical protein
MLIDVGIYTGKAKFYNHQDLCSVSSGRSLVWLGHQLPKLTTRVQIPATALPFSSILSSIYLLGGNTTKQTGIYGYDKIFELAMKRLQEEPNDADEDKASISKLVEHLLW